MDNNNLNEEVIETPVAKNENQGENILAILSMIFGIISATIVILLCCFSFFRIFGVFFAIAAIVLGIIGTKTRGKDVKSTVGIICGAVALVVGIIFIVIEFLFAGAYFGIGILDIILQLISGNTNF